jgi:hypothetical protein
MTPIIDETNVNHSFDLSGLKAGDTFLGCPKCWEIHAVNAVGVLECRICMGRPNLYTVNESDLVKNEHH